MFELIQALVISYLPLYEIQMLAYYSDIKAADSVYRQLLQNRFLLANHIMTQAEEMAAIVKNILSNWREIVIKRSDIDPLLIIKDLSDEHTDDDKYARILNLRGLHIYHYYPALFKNTNLDDIFNMIDKKISNQSYYWASLMIQLYVPPYDKNGKLCGQIDIILARCSYVNSINYEYLTYEFHRLYNAEAVAVPRVSIFYAESEVFKNTAMLYHANMFGLHAMIYFGAYKTFAVSVDEIAAVDAITEFKRGPSIDVISRSKKIILIYLHQFPDIVIRFAEIFLKLSIYLGDDEVYNFVSKLVENVCDLSMINIYTSKIFDYNLIRDLAISGKFAKQLLGYYSLPAYMPQRSNFVDIDTLKLYENRVNTHSIMQYATLIGDLETIRYLHINSTEQIPKNISEYEYKMITQS